MIASQTLNPMTKDTSGHSYIVIQTFFSCSAAFNLSHIMAALHHSFLACISLVQGLGSEVLAQEYSHVNSNSIPTPIKIPL